MGSSKISFNAGCWPPAAVAAHLLWSSVRPTAELLWRDTLSDEEVLAMLAAGLPDDAEGRGSGQPRRYLLRFSPNFTYRPAKHLILLGAIQICSHNILQIPVDTTRLQ